MADMNAPASLAAVRGLFELAARKGVVLREDLPTSIIIVGTTITTLECMPDRLPSENSSPSLVQTQMTIGGITKPLMVDEGHEREAKADIFRMPCENLLALFDATSAALKTASTRTSPALQAGLKVIESEWSRQKIPGHPGDGTAG
jgi:hypothetical protein